MAFRLTDLLQAVYGDLGQNETFLATSGNQTTAVNSVLQTVDAPPDDNYCKEGTLFVLRDAAGLSAAPEGEFGRVQGYDSSNFTYTVDTTFTAGMDVGDTIMIASNQFPLREMIRCCNRALQVLGRVDLVDTSITTVATHTEYDLPVIMKLGKFIKIEYQANTADADDNQWLMLPQDSYYISPAVPGSVGRLVFRDSFPAGHILRIWYSAVHPTLSAFNSIISETIPEQLLISYAVVEALKWYITKGSGDSTFWMERLNWAKSDLEDAKRTFSVTRTKRATRFLTY
jgi:hypothetical protein